MLDSMISILLSEGDPTNDCDLDASLDTGQTIEDTPISVGTGVENVANGEAI
jgi:hypothetical protein